LYSMRCSYDGLYGFLQMRSQHLQYDRTLSCQATLWIATLSLKATLAA